MTMTKNTTSTTKSRRGGKRPGAGAPLAGKGPSEKLVIRVSPEMGEFIRALALCRNKTSSEIVRDAIIKYRQQEMEEASLPVNDTYVRADCPEIVEAMARGLRRQESRITAGDMICAEEAATMQGMDVRQVQTLCRTMRIIGLKIPGRVTAWTLPRWQFQEAILPHIPEIAQALGARDGWAVLRFLEAPLGGLDGITPREALERGQHDRVLQLAAAEAH